MSQPLLIHSLAEFANVTLPALELCNARRVCEIGAEHGGNSEILAGWLEGNGGFLTSIDPAPSPAFHGWLASHSKHVCHVKRPSLEAIPTVQPQDAWFVDGDHNWYTVYHELAAIHEVQRMAARPLLVFLHDVGWPWARRDLYYAPDRIPGEFRQNHSWDHGVTLDNPHAIKGGFRGCGAFAVAMREGGPRNGVLTAIEDFFGAHSDEFFWAFVPGVFGLGILFSRDHPAAQGLANLLAPLHENALLKRLESNRLANYLKVIELQDAAEEKQATACV